MAQGKTGKISNLDIDALEDVLIADVSGFKVMWLDLLIGVAALTAFTVEYRVTGLGAWLPMASAGADYTTPVAPVLKASGALPTATPGQHFLKLDITGIHSVRIRAAGTNTTIVGSWSLG